MQEEKETKEDIQNQQLQNSKEKQRQRKNSKYSTLAKNVGNQKIKKRENAQENYCRNKMALKRKFINIELLIIGETISVLGTPDFLNGKTIKLDLTRKLRGKSLEIIFKIQTSGEKLIGIPKKLHLMKSYIRRMLRKKTNYVEDSFKTECKDLRIIIKPFLITRKKVSRAVRKNLRNTARELLINYIKEKNYLEVCEEIIKGELQKQLLPKLKKIYPLSFCDIRVFETKELKKLDLEEKVETKKDSEKPKTKTKPTSKTK